jgi:hypothetical protein
MNPIQPVQPVVPAIYQQQRGPRVPVPRPSACSARSGAPQTQGPGTSG